MSALVQSVVARFAETETHTNFFYLLSYSGSMVVTPGECNMSKLFTLVQSFTILP